ncbi:MAG TPA: ATP-binding cassette domain-containing protein, partial [Actinomycetota bacterium]
MPAPLLQTTAVAKAFGPVVALRGVDLSVAPGEVHALLGANGAGKSTLVKILTGVLSNDSGTVAVNGRPVDLDSPNEARSQGLAPVYQDPALIPDLTVEQNLRLTGVDPAAVRRELAGMDLDGLDLGEQVRDIPLPFLRMLDLARALAFDPQLLLLDEITAALPPDLSERVFAITTRWKQRNRSVLFISHRLAEVREHCDMCTVLRDGRDVASFHPGQGGESQIVAAMLGEASAAVRDVARERR